MFEKRIDLNKLPKATDVIVKYYSIKTSEGDSFLCELLGSESTRYEGLHRYPITEEEKERTKVRLSLFLEKNNLIPEIIHPSETYNRKSNFRAEDTIVSDYTLFAYRIKERL